MKKARFTKTASIKKNVAFSFLLIIIMMVLPTVYSVTTFHIHTSRYDKILTNVSQANKLGIIAKVQVADEIWDIVAGLKTFNQGQQYLMLREIRNGIASMKETSSPENRELLEVASRTEKTLEKYTQRLGDQISGNATVAENQSIMEEIRGVASLLYDIFQDYIVEEIKSAETANERMRNSSLALTIIQVSISTIALLITLFTSSNLSNTIRTPILNMEQLSSRIANGDLSARAEQPHVQELDRLAANLNIMAERIKQLIDQNIKEQQNLKKAEMRTLQAQITPHFLYNTFDSIIWLAESERIEDVVDITRAFSNYFRISLSKGLDWITIDKELEHVRNYLTVQKIRYENILTYEIECDEGIGEVPVLKLILQPLVENAIYHGIKNKRGRGKIKVCAKDSGDKVLLSVSDNGIGFTKERLDEVLLEFESEPSTETVRTSYGLYNVNKRLKLYYNNTVSMNINSEYGEGTEVSFSIPKKRQNADIVLK